MICPVIGTCRIGIQVLCISVLWPHPARRVTRLHHRWVRMKQTFSFSNVCPDRGLNTGPRSIMTVKVTTQLRRNPPIGLLYDYDTWTKTSETEKKIDACEMWIGF